MESERDPRVDPRPGDVVSVPDLHPLGVAEKRTVDYLINGGLRWSGSLRETSKSYTCSQKTWRRWAKDGEIVARSASPQAQEPTQ